EPKRRGARRKPRQQHERGRDLVPAGEVMLDKKRTVIAEGFRFDVEIDEIMKALAHRGADTRATSLPRTKDPKPHSCEPLIHVPQTVALLRERSRRTAEPPSSVMSSRRRIC